MLIDQKIKHANLSPYDKKVEVNHGYDAQASIVFCIHHDCQTLDIFPVIFHWLVKNML